MRLFEFDQDDQHEEAMSDVSVGVTSWNSYFSRLGATS
jgi:hypothetical protein